jgi:hypothetical protein
VALAADNALGKFPQTRFFVVRNLRERVIVLASTPGRQGPFVYAERRVAWHMRMTTRLAKFHKKKMVFARLEAD